MARHRGGLVPRHPQAGPVAQRGLPVAHPRRGPGPPALGAGRRPHGSRPPPGILQHRCRHDARAHRGNFRAALERGGHLRGDPPPPGRGDPAAVVGLGDRPDHPGLDGAVFAGLPDGAADAGRRFVAGAPVGLV